MEEDEAIQVYFKYSLHANDLFEISEINMLFHNIPVRKTVYDCIKLSEYNESLKEI